VLYAGSFSRYYDVPNLVKAATLLRERLTRFHLMLLGTGLDWKAVERMIKQNSLENVTLVGPVAPAAVGAYLQAADLFVFSLGGTFPSTLQNYLTTKLCEYLMVGKPVIAVDNGVVCGDFLERIGAGLGIRVHQPEALAEAIVSFALNPNEATRCGNKARQYARAYLERRKVMERFYAELVQKLDLPG
jgi:glycosyltransferase involved in cell wall biosynthesis